MEDEGEKKYVYRKFAPIRLLRVRRAIDGTIQGHLENFDLDDVRCPDFVTISYVWGSPQKTQAIQLDGIPFRVLESLYPLLAALCDDASAFDPDGGGSGGWFWIDSVCIDLEDEHERGLQVQLMGRIYRQSARTVVWLGEGTPGTDRAMAFLADLGAAGFVDTRHLAGVVQRYERAAAELQVLFRLPWWTRTWTLQEFVLPDALDLHCGARRLSYREFHIALGWLYECWASHGVGAATAAPAAEDVDTNLDANSTTTTLAASGPVATTSTANPAVGRSQEDDDVVNSGIGPVWGTAWGRRRVRERFRNEFGPDVSGLSLVALLGYTSDYRCTDARDRVYSLLGLVREGDRAIVGRPSYGAACTAESLYRDLVCRFIDATRSLDIIFFAALFSDVPPPPPPLLLPLWPPSARVSASAASQWPSWVPDWRVRVRPHIVPLLVSQPGRSHIGCFMPKSSIVRRGDPVVFAASGSLKETARTGPSPWRTGPLARPMLHCRGIYLGSIDGIATRLLGENETTEELQPNFKQSTSEINLSKTSCGATSGSQPACNEGDHSSNEGHTRLCADILGALTVNRVSRYLDVECPIRLFLSQTRQLRSSLWYNSRLDPDDERVDQLVKRWVHLNEAFLVRGHTLLDICHMMSPQEPSLPFSQRILETIGSGDNSLQKLLATTTRGHVGLVPRNAVKGDQVWVLRGASVPAVLRRCLEEPQYFLIGECYIHNFMNGEAFSEGARVDEVRLV